MKAKYVVFLLLAIISVSNACSQSVQPPPDLSQQPTAPSTDGAVGATEDANTDSEHESEQPELTDVFPDLYAVTNIYVSAGSANYRFGSTGPYAKADEAQVRQIIEMLSLIDTASFENCDKTEVNGKVVQLRFETALESCTVQILRPPHGAVDDGIIYITFPVYSEDDWLTMLNSPEISKELLEEADRATLRFKGSSGAFLAYELEQVCGIILSDNIDVENIGIVRMLDNQESEHVIRKGDCAIARYILDGSINYSGDPYQTSDGLMHIDAYEAADNATYDVRLLAGDTTYLLDTSSGYFSRAHNGETVFGRLGGFLEKVRLHLGVPVE
jgi:hypothetical protein